MGVSHINYIIYKIGLNNPFEWFYDHSSKIVVSYNINNEIIAAYTDFHRVLS